MADDTTVDEPSYSMRLIRPFLEVLRATPGYPVEVLAPIDALHDDEMLPIARVHKMLRGAIGRTTDPDLGLKAANVMAAGDLGAVDYAVSSAANVGEALNVAGRYWCLVNRAVDFQVRVDEGRAIVRWSTHADLPRAAADFQVAAFYVRHARRWPSVVASSLEAWFTHPTPASLTEYHRVFGATKLRFDAPFCGFTFDMEGLEAPLRTADPELHRMIRGHTERMLASLPVAQRFTEQVRNAITNDLAGRQPSLTRVARSLHVSTRTLSRKLEAEGTSFTELLDDLRRRLGVQYVASSDLSFGEVALLLGYAQTTAFHRAFKRWTGQTPLDHRRQRRP